MSYGTRWSEVEIKTLINLYPIKTAQAIAEMLDRPIHSVRKKAENLGLQGTTDLTKAHRYAGHIDFVREHIATRSVEWIAIRLGRTPEAVRSLCKRNKISFDKCQSNSKKTRSKRWEEKERRLLMQHITDNKTDELSISHLSQTLNRSKSSIKSQLRQLRKQQL